VRADGKEKLSHLIRLDRKKFLLFFLPCRLRLPANLENNVENPKRIVTKMAMRIRSQELQLELVM
jgi:hypothetical protein